MADEAHGAEVVRDEQIGGAELALQPDQQIDDLGARRRIERRGRLVEHDQLGAGDDGAADADALLLAGAELGRELVEHAFGEAKTAGHLAHPPLAVGARHAEVAQRLAQRLADAHARVERLGRLLEDELDAAAQLPGADVAAAPHRLAVEPDAAGRGIDQAEDAAADRGLAGARFADQRQRLAAARW